MTSHLRGAYGLVVALALLGLCPDLVLSTAFLPLGPPVSQDLGMSTTWLQVSNGLSDAAFAVGVVLAAQLAQRYVQRPLYLGYAATFVLGSLLVAAAPATAAFVAGRVLQGGATGLMMIAALPPLVTRYGVSRVPLSAAIVNLGLFGATTLGPLVGGLVAGSGSWRALMWVIAVLGALAFAAAYLGYPTFDPVDPDLPVDVPALSLSLVGATLLFLATSVVSATSLRSWEFWTLCLAGVAALGMLIVLEAHRESPLMPVRELSTQLPVTGTLVAMVAGATFVTAVGLAQLYLTDVVRLSPATAGALFWTMPVGLVPAAVAFGVLFRTRWLPYLVNLGLLALLVGTALLLVLGATGPTSLIAWAALMWGFGAGATVAPGLFLAGLGVRSFLLGRAFALVQLLRLTATFAVAPVVLYLARRQASPLRGVHLGTWITLGLALVGLLGSVAIPLVSGARPHAPDLERWLEQSDRGLQSPALAAPLRHGVEDEDAPDPVPEWLRRGRGSP